VGDEGDFTNDRELVAGRLDRAILSADGIELHVRRTGGDVDLIRVLWNAPRHRRRRSIGTSDEKNLEQNTFARQRAPGC